MSKEEKGRHGFEKYRLQSENSQIRALAPLLFYQAAV